MREVHLADKFISLDDSIHITLDTVDDKKEFELCVYENEVLVSMTRLYIYTSVNMYPPLIVDIDRRLAADDLVHPSRKIHKLSFQYPFKRYTTEEYYLAWAELLNVSMAIFNQVVKCYKSDKKIYQFMG